MLWCGSVWAKNPPGIYEFTTYCHPIRRPCGVIINQKSEGDSEEFIAHIWKDKPSNSKTVKISNAKFKHIDRTFHLMHLWKIFEKGPYPLDKLPPNDHFVLVNTKTLNGEHHILVPRYSSDLTSVQKLVLDWENFLKAQVMKINTAAFKKDF